LGETAENDRNMKKVLDSATLPRHEFDRLEKWASNQATSEQSRAGLHLATMTPRCSSRYRSDLAGWTKTVSNAMVGHGVFPGTIIDSGSGDHFGLFVLADRRDKRASHQQSCRE
jgi:hypothetical protein